jgi:Family of unknown function (DUF6445)
VTLAQLPFLMVAIILTMKHSIIVVDAFYNDPHDVREVALNSDFCVRGNYPGLRTGPFLHDGIRNAIQLIVRWPITFWPEDTYNGAFQYTTVNDRTWVHSDHTTNFAGVLYLTPDAPPQAGTAFFRHISTKLDYYPSDPALQKLCDADAGDPSKWLKTDTVANVFNRLLLFDSTRFHASEQSFGEGRADARLFQTFFFSVAYPDLEQLGELSGGSLLELPPDSSAAPISLEVHKPLGLPPV